MIQDIYPHIYRNEYTPKKPEKESFVCVYRGREVLLKDCEEIVFPTIAELEKYDTDFTEKCTYFSRLTVGRSIWQRIFKRIGRILLEEYGDVPQIETAAPRFCGNYRISTVPLVSVPQILRKMRKGNG